MGRYLKSSSALITPSPALVTSLSVNALPNKIAANFPNSIGRNPPFCSFVSFLTVSLIYFTSNSDLSSDLTIFIKSSISSFEIINAVVLWSITIFLNGCISC